VLFLLRRLQGGVGFAQVDRRLVLEEWRDETSTGDGHVLGGGNVCVGSDGWKVDKIGDIFRRMRASNRMGAGVDKGVQVQAYMQATCGLSWRAWRGHVGQHLMSRAWRRGSTCPGSTGFVVGLFWGMGVLAWDRRRVLAVKGSTAGRPCFINAGTKQKGVRHGWRRQLVRAQTKTRSAWHEILVMSCSVKEHARGTCGLCSSGLACEASPKCL